jgi:hypothetical protein
LKIKKHLITNQQQTLSRSQLEETDLRKVDIKKGKGKILFFAKNEAIA